MIGAEIQTLEGFFDEWEDSAVAAMQAQPRYFARWYTVKSIALALSLGVIGYLVVTRRR